jgi:hypothetical protein
MNEIFAAIEKGQLEEALIRLWLLALKDDNNATHLSRWQQTQAAGSTIPPIAQWLDAWQTAHRAQVESHPLALLQALDEFLGQQTRYSIQSDNTFKDLVDERGITHTLVRRRLPRHTPANQQTPNIEHWCHHHTLISSPIVSKGGELHIEFMALRTRSITGKQLKDCLTGQQAVKIRLSHFDDGVALTFEEESAPDRFFAAGLTDEALRQKHLLAELAEAVNTHWWVAPELTVPVPMQNEISKLLAANPNSLLVAVPGSFHYYDGEDRRNRAQIFDGYGKSLFSHDKLTQFSDRDAKPNVHENILVATRLVLVDTPLGLVGVAICKDFCDVGNSALLNAWNDIAPDWLLVPSYGNAEDTLKAHQKRALEHWSSRQTRSLVANQQRHYAATCDEPTPGFLQDGKASTPVAVGGSTLEALLKQELNKVKIYRVK